ncbi:MAG TPA: lytic murein transglycosylase [Methyloceanibacter sp.]|jgi:lytic murein transglycosylase|nr:lytic murein transglycosylase [Methyloceanibacter sp.]
MARHPSMICIARFTALGVVAAAVTFLAAPHALAACSNNPAQFSRWLQGFKQEAVGQGISARTVNYALDGLSYDPATIAKDRGQGVFAQSFVQFSGRMVSSNRLQVGAQLLKKHANVFAKIQQQYGVPGPVLVAFWGLETDFGKVMGNMETMRSLATLSFDCRRPEEFREQLVYALRVIERGDLSPPEMRGPAHGEVGQFQFQPKNYYEYAVDFDGDGRRDLIRSAPDSLASAANYLHSIGWRPNQPWLEQVRVPANLPWDRADVTIKNPRSFWAQHGVTYLNGQPIPADETPVGLVLPMGRNGPAFLAYPNFDIYLEWNKSLVYSTTAAYYASRLAGGPALAKGNAPVETLSPADTKELQQRLAQLGFDVGKIDGVVGAASRNAIRAMQVKYGLPADGYPSAALLGRLRAGR